MGNLFFVFFAVAIAGFSPTLAEESLPVTSSDSLVREPRTLLKKKLCRKYGICEGYGGQGGYGGYGGYQGYQGNQGYQGYQGYPPINIAISQSQSSANEGGGGHGSGYFPNNYQYNGGYPNGYYNQGYPNFGYLGYRGYKPGYSNGNGAYNSQFNGNYYSGPQTGGYGFQGFGPRDEGYGVGDDYDDGERYGSYAFARSSANAVAESKI